MNQRRARLVVKPPRNHSFGEYSGGVRRTLLRQSAWPNAHGQILIAINIVYNKIAPFILTRHWAEARRISSVRY